jgi:hypothetical protein
MNDILLASVSAGTDGGIILTDPVSLLDELTGSERERFLCLCIRPDGGMYHVYAHLSHFAMHEDDWVLAPDLIEDEENEPWL